MVVVVGGRVHGDNAGPVVVDGMHGAAVVVVGA